MTTENAPPLPRIVIDKGTLVPLGVVLSFIGSLATMAGWMNGKFESIESAVVKIEHRMERLEDRQGDRWTASDMKLWEVILSRENPAIKAPGVGTIVRERPEGK